MKSFAIVALALGAFMFSNLPASLATPATAAKAVCEGHNDDDKKKCDKDKKSCCKEKKSCTKEKKAEK